MKFNKVLTGFSSQTDAEVETASKTILNSLRGNKKFPSCVSAVAELEAFLPSFIAAREAASMSDAKALTETKNLAREQVIFLLIFISCFVNGDGKGDLAILKDAGYALSTPSAPVAIARPEGLILSPGVTVGFMIAKITTTVGSLIRYFEITSNELNANTIWMRHDTGRKNFTFNGLISGVKYFVRVGVKNENGVMIYSEIVSQFAV